MFTDPKIYNSKDLSIRGFISFHYEGKRYRFYTGNALGVNSISKQLYYLRCQGTVVEATLAELYPGTPNRMDS